MKPTSRPPVAGYRLGQVWVAAQFGLLGVLGLRALAGVGDAQAWALTLAGLAGATSAVLGLWTLRHNRPGNFRIHPHPHPNGALVTDGPYRWMRHPMYGSVLLLAAAMALLAGDAWGSALWLILLGVLDAKARIEERALGVRYPDYAAYCQRCARWWPRRRFASPVN